MEEGVYRPTMSRLEPDTTMNAADQPVVTTIARRDHTALQSADHQAFFAVLDTPPNPTEKLRAAFTRYHETITSR